MLVHIQCQPINKEKEKGIQISNRNYDELRHRSIKTVFFCHLAWQSLVMLCWDIEIPARRSCTWIHHVLFHKGVWAECRHYLSQHRLLELSPAPVQWTETVQLLSFTVLPMFLLGILREHRLSLVHFTVCNEENNSGCIGSATYLLI